MGNKCCLQENDLNDPNVVSKSRKFRKSDKKNALPDGITNRNALYDSR